MPHFWIIAVVLLSAAAACAEARVSLPLEGRFRAGRFMPVRVRVDHAATGWISVRGHGLISATLPLLNDGVDTILPCLVVDSRLSNLTWNDGMDHPLNVPPRIVEPTERLVGLAGVELDAAWRLFGDRSISVSPVSLDPVQPLPGITGAWEALDAICLGENAASRVTERVLRDLLAAGVTVAVRSQARPAGSWPWKREDEFWVIRHSRLGPQSVVEADAYEPTYAWRRGRPLAFRRRVFLVGLILVAAMLACVLWRSRLSFLAVTGVSIASAGGLMAWQARLPSLVQLTGRVEIHADGLTQADEWTWLSSRAGGEATYAPHGLARPIFSRPPADAMAFGMICRADASPPVFRFTLPPGGTCAFVSRTVAAAAPAPATAPAESLFSQMVRDVYGADGIIGIAAEPPTENHLATVVVQR